MTRQTGQLRLQYLQVLIMMIAPAIVMSATAAALYFTTSSALSVIRSCGGQHEYVRQLWAGDGYSDKNAF